MRIGIGCRVLSVLAAFALSVCASGSLVSSAQAVGTSCANEQLRVEQAYARELPDCRAYEMVSPVDKNDNSAVTESGTRASTSGEAITYRSAGSFASPVGARYRNQYVSRRGSSGWSTQSITPPTSAINVNIYVPYEDMIFTPDLSMGVTINGDPSLSSDASVGYENVYQADTTNGTYQLVSNPEPHEEPYILRNKPELGGASTDLSHVVSFIPEEGTLYEWVEGHLTVINNRYEALPGNGQGSYGGQDDWHAVSADGSRVFYTSLVQLRFGEEETPIENQLYVRENGKTTIKASASQRIPEDPHGPRGAEFASASADGSVVFFTSRAELTQDANTGNADGAQNLYAYDTESGHLTDLSVDSNSADVNGAAVLGLVTTSEDGSYVYYVAEGDLAGAAVLGQPNLYLYHKGVTTFITTLASDDRGDWRELDGGPAGHTVRVTPDGVNLAFLSVKSLTGYDNTDENIGKLDEEVFSYDADTSALSCVSCNPNGARPIGSSSLGEKTSLFYITRNFSEDGKRLFFQSGDALVAHDSNGRQDVYEYEDGHVHPVSDVAGGYDSTFLDASPNGDDVFIGTADRLLAQDRDLRVDVYDARVDGGFPAAAVPPPVCDNGDACKPPVAPQPATFGAPASATFAGAGNLAPVEVKPAVRARTKPKQCKKRFVRRRGKCVRKHANKSSEHSKKGRK